jgi:hypothetical protein
MLSITDAARSASKLCCSCKLDLPYSSFSLLRSSKDGLAPKCRSCRRIYRAKWNDAHRDQKRESDRQAGLRRHSKGLCTHCGKPNDRLPKWQCSACAEYANIIRNPHRVAAAPCVFCGFEYADVHHIDGNHENNEPGNLIALCPNHHRLVHLGLLDM